MIDLIEMTWVSRDTGRILWLSSKLRLVSIRKHRFYIFTSKANSTLESRMALVWQKNGQLRVALDDF
jgi:hypothetical protein